MIRCPNCGEENPERARFCLSCGTALPEPASAPRASRKTVTVVFADVTGSTSLGERLDPESLRNLMSRYFEAARRVMERHGGTVEKFIGDAVMAVFGIPALHEDDALRIMSALHRNPRLSAKAVETLDEISGGRFVFGRTEPLGIANHEVPHRRSCRPVRHDSARIHFRSVRGEA